MARLLAFLVWCGTIARLSAAPLPATSRPTSRMETAAPRRVLVELNAGSSSASIPLAVAQLRESLAGFAGRVVRTYAHLPYAVVETGVPDASLARLGPVRRVHPPTTYAPQAEAVDSRSLVRQPEAVARGVTGRGTSVVVLDTGADWTHPDLGACSAPGTAGCRVRFAADMTPEDDGVSDDVRRHGTNVASIIARVAPETDIIALDVFQGTGREGSDENILGGLDWTVAHRSQYDIVAVNISLGSGAFRGFCPGTSLAAGIAAVRAAGVSVVSAAGNDAMTDRIAAPACVPGVVSVGNVWTADVGTVRSAYCTDLTTGPDTITCMSNTAACLSVLAPGSLVQAGGVTLSGTSQATPHVTAALAMLRGQSRSGSLDEVESRLLTSGRRVYDTRSKFWFPRLDIAAALDGAVDESAPVGSLRVNGDPAWVHGGGSLVLISDVTDESNVVEMCLSEADACDDWTTFETARLWPVPTGRSGLTLNGWYRDRFGHVAGPLTATLGIDEEPPADGPLTVTAAGRTVTFAWSGATDALSGVAGYSIIEGFGKFPVDCIRGLVVDFGDVANGSISVRDVAAGSEHYYRHCVVDAAGNYSSGQTAFIAIDRNAKADDAGAAGDASNTGGFGCSCSPEGALLLTGLVGRLRRRDARSPRPG